MTGGELADAYDKARVARGIKLAEIGVQAIAAAGFWFDSLAVLYVALFGLGVIAALFGPLKYGILPDHVREDELVAANALIEGATFLAILLGLVAGGLSIAEGRSNATVVAQLIAIAIACYIASRLIPPAPPQPCRPTISRNPFAASFRLVWGLRDTPAILPAGRAVSWFWMTGAVALSLVPLIARKGFGAGIEVETAVSALFAIGIAVGSLIAARVARGRLLLWPISAAACLMALFLIDLGISTYGLPAATHVISLQYMAMSPAGWRFAGDIIGLAAAGGFFVVPAFALVQARADAERRARTIAAVNIQTALYMVGGTVVTAALQLPAVGLDEPMLLLILGVLNVAAGWYFHRALAAVAL